MQHCCLGVGDLMFGSKPTVGSDHGKSALHINAKVEVPEQNWTPRVSKVDIIEAQDGWGHWLSCWELENVLRILLNELGLAETLNSFDSGLHQGCPLGIEPELVDESLQAQAMFTCTLWIYAMQRSAAAQD